jgi:hypothetical protein
MTFRFTAFEPRAHDPAVDHFATRYHHPGDRRS